MKTNSIKKKTNFILFFLISVLIIIGSGYYKTAVAKETAIISVNLKDEKIKTITYDIANQGIPKRIVQPGKITLSSGHADAIINNTDKPILVQIKTQSFNQDINIDINSSDKSFDKKSRIFKKSLEAGKGVSLSLTFNIPRGNIQKGLVCNGEIVFTNAENGDLINMLPVQIINSNA